MKNHPRVDKTALLIAALLCVKLALQLYLYNIGFLSVSADEYSRGITAARWALDGAIPVKLYMYAWLPFETYVNGLSLMVWDDLIWTPRITAFVFSCVLLVYFVKLVERLFGLFPVTAVSGLLLVFNPWFVWLSGTPMLDIYYLAPFVAGLYYVLKWILKRQYRFLIAGGALFFVSTGFHSQSWILVNTVLLCLCYFVPDMYRRKDYRGLLLLCGFFILSNLFIFIYLPAEYFATGKWLYMFRDHTSGTMSHYNGYDVGLTSKLAYYPELVLFSGGIVWLLLPLGLYRLVSASGRYCRLFPFTVGLAALIVYSVYNVISVPASAAPGRYALPFFILFMPYAALGIDALFGERGYLRRMRFRRVLAALLILSLLGASLRKCLDYETRGARPAVDAGLFVKEAMEEEGADPEGTVMIELAYWDFLYVNLAVRYFDRVRYDRARTYRQSSIPSDLLGMSDDEILERAGKEKTTFIVVRDTSIRDRLSGLGFVRGLKDFGEWTVYRVDLKRDD